MLRRLVLFYVAIVFVCSDGIYEGHKLFRIQPTRESERRRILEFATKNQTLYDIWNAHRSLGSPINIAVAPEGMQKFHDLLHHHNASYEITIPDIMKAVKVERNQNTIARYRRMFRTLWKNDHDYYRTVAEINNAIDKYQRKYPFVKVKELGTTFEGRPIRALMISKDETKPIIWIDAGIHAREWIAPAAALYVIDKLLTRGGQQLLKKHQFFIIPLVNPDGYEYTHAMARMWRKNRSRIPGETCLGVDLNRNFPLKWGTGDGTSPRACDETFHGIDAASELESQAIIKGLTQMKDKLILYLNLHSYGQYILTPYGFTRYRYPKNYPNMLKLGKLVRDEIHRKHHYVYQVGSASDLLYEASGGVDDYVSGVLNVPYSYTIELCDEGRYGFLLPASYIRNVGEQLWTAVKVFSHNL